MQRDQLRAMLVDDGTFVVYGPNGPLWNSKTWGHPNAKLTFKNTEPYLSHQGRLDGAVELGGSATCRAAD